MKNKPNIVFVFADQWRAQATGYAGDPNALTPNLDKLATESANFTNAVSGCPVCCPARASFLTGQYPHKHGVFINDVPLNNNTVSIADAFKESGYDTGYIGKWHIDGHGRSAPIPKERRHGFDYWRTLECTHDYNNSPYYTEQNDIKQNWNGYDAIEQTDCAINYINEHTEKPFFLTLSWGPPHSPYETAPEKYQKMFKPENIILRPNIPKKSEKRAREELAGYYAHIVALDEQIGRLTSTLKATNLAKNTIFVFWSDHGDMHGSHGKFRKNHPWDESILVPFLIKAPNVKSANFAEPINTPDIMPTLLSLCDVEIPKTCDGNDYSKLLTNKEKINDDGVLIATYCATPEYLGENKYNKPCEFRGIKTKTHTYIRKHNAPWLLYDNIKDPYQTKNLILPFCNTLLQVELDNKLKALLLKYNDNFSTGKKLLKKWNYKINKDGFIPYIN
jgi:arylsulfatase A-like enzyme